MTEMSLLLLATLGVGALLGIVLCKLRGTARMVAGSTALAGLLLVPALADSDVGQLEALPEAAMEALHGPQFAFSINFNEDDKWSVGVNPSAKFRVGRPDELGRPGSQLVATFTVMKFQVNSHCYTVISGGKAYEVCPAH
jgi:hypothetical protein